MPAQAGLNIPSKALIGHGLLLDCAAQGFTMIRIDCQEVGKAGDLELSRDMIHEVLDAGLIPLAIIHHPAQMVNVSQDARFCFWNEPNLNHDTIRYSRASRCAADAACYLRRQLYLGGVSNPNQDGLHFLNRLHWDDWDPAYIGCELHWYPDNAHGPRIAHFPPSTTREEEVANVRTIVGERDYLIGEIGYNGLDYSETQVSENLAWERTFWSDEGFSAVCVYQINDGEDRSEILNTYGLKRLDSGEWKPAAAAFCHAL